jgi:hypothetical protein
MANEKRLIDANRAFEKADEVTFMGFHAEERKRHFMDLVSVILDCPTVDAVEVKHGRWLFDSNTERYFCSVCNEQALSTSNDEPVYDYDSEENLRYSHTETIFEEHLTNYCPNCGADMR